MNILNNPRAKEIEFAKIPSRFNARQKYTMLNSIIPYAEAKLKRTHDDEQKEC